LMGRGGGIFPELEGGREIPKCHVWVRSWIHGGGGGEGTGTDDQDKRTVLRIEEERLPGEVGGRGRKRKKRSWGCYSLLVRAEVNSGRS